MPPPAPNPQPPNITALKSTFLTTQVRLLSSPLRLPPSSSSSSNNTAASIPPKHLTDLLKQTNDKIRTHNRSVFPAQAQHHVAEQIETLFWNEVVGEREEGGGASYGAGHETVVRRDADFVSGTSTDDVEVLPEEWADVSVIASAADNSKEESDHQDRETRENNEDAARYAALRSKLASLRKRRNEAVRKVQRYKQLQTLLQPYENAQERVQPNLVTRDGELMREMERMRVLLTRVTARMGGAYQEDHHDSRRALMVMGNADADAGAEAGPESFRERVAMTMAVE